MNGYTGRYHLIDLDAELELYDSSTPMACWQRIDKPSHVICKDDGEIIAGHADMLDKIMSEKKYYVAELIKAKA